MAFNTFATDNEMPDNSRPGNLNFGVVLHALKDGHAATREGWNGPGQYIMLQVPDAHSKMTRAYIYITTVDGDRVPWLASQTDMLAEDWTLLLEKPNV